MLYILHNSEDGIRTEAIERDAFPAWFKENFEDVSPEYMPRFVATIPAEESDPYEYTIIDGEPIIPKAVTVVQEYVLEKKRRF